MGKAWEAVGWNESHFFLLILASPLGRRPNHDEASASEDGGAAAVAGKEMDVLKGPETRWK